MPNVPKVPGVPNLASYAAGTIALMIEDAIGSLVFGNSASVWGVYQDGLPVIDHDSFVAFDFRQDFSILDYPVEDGGFQSYNKVQLPPEIRVRVSCGGPISRRQAFLASIDAVMSTTELYDVVTPETVYLGYNFSHRDFRRAGDQHNGLIVVDLWLTRIRETSSATFTNTQQPPAAGQQNTGNVQPQTPNDRISSAFDAGGWRIE